jgi:hypothetical protein
MPGTDVLWGARAYINTPAVANTANGVAQAVDTLIDQRVTLLAANLQVFLTQWEARCRHTGVFGSRAATRLTQGQTDVTTYTVSLPNICGCE